MDAGCGTALLGDVNCDLFIVDRLNHRHVKDVSVIDVKGRNFVKCSVEFLPFKNCVFDKVISHQVIEHVFNPFLLFSELCRVSSREVEVECPHRLGDRLRLRMYGWVRRHHVSVFNFGWFDVAARRCGFKVVFNEVYIWLHFPHVFVPLLRFPLSIRVVCRRVLS